MEGIAQRRVAPLLKADLIRVLAAMGDTPKDIRDKALLLVGFAGAFRRSELVALDRDDIEFTDRGLIIQIRRSKPDQFGAGRRIGIPFVTNSYCPVSALKRWLSFAGIDNGWVFRRVDRCGRILSPRISGAAVALVVKERVAAAGLDAADCSGHSLRAGFVTSSALAGLPTWKIRRQTGHASDIMASRYIRTSNSLKRGDAIALL